MLISPMRFSFTIRNEGRALVDAPPRVEAQTSRILTGTENNLELIPVVNKLICRVRNQAQAIEQMSIS